MRTAEEMRVVLENWENSGLSQRSFAVREGISYTTMQYWRRRLKVIDAEATADADDCRGFVPVEVLAPESVETAKIELRIGDDLLLSIPTGLDSKELRRIVSVIREC